MDPDFVHYPDSYTNYRNSDTYWDYLEPYSDKDDPCSYVQHSLGDLYPDSYQNVEQYPDLDQDYENLDFCKDPDPGPFQDAVDPDQTKRRWSVDLSFAYIPFP